MNFPLAFSILTSLVRLFFFRLPIMKILVVIFFTTKITSLFRSMLSWMDTHCCLGIGKCCPITAKCCPWGYCINPGDTCCPSNPCSAGWNCCGTTHCSPVGAQCCRDGSYCSIGNICVIVVRTGQIGCCTDLSCTAHVVSGTTSYLRPTNPPVTQPPPPVTTRVDSYTTYYWTVTWWYYSYYWVTFQLVQSTVTYTQVYRTTTFTTTATDDSQARSYFVALSKTLHFDPPPDAQTGLASLVNVLPSQTAPFSFDDDSTTFPSPTESSSSTSEDSTLDLPTLSFPTLPLPTSLGNFLPSLPVPTGPGGSLNSASGVFVQWALVGLGALSGVLMLWL